MCNFDSALGGLAEYVLDNVDVIELSEDTTTTSNVDFGDSRPMFKKKKVFGVNCIEVDDETYSKCIRGRVPYSRWSKFIEDEQLRDEMKRLFNSNKKVLMKNSRTGGMVYVKNAKNEGR